MGKKRRRADAGIPPEQSKKARIDTSESLPEGVHHYQDINDVPWDLQNYWRQGYDFFSKYDDGIWMTDSAWFGVTPEAIANKISSHITSSLPPNRSIILDAFAGVGGNTIAFALSGKFKRVYAIEKDEATLKCAQHNAEIYGVADKITWFHGDCFELLGLHGDPAKAVEVLKVVVGQFGVIFASPPWGGKVEIALMHGFDC